MDRNTYNPNDVVYFELFFVDPITKKSIIYEKDKNQKLWEKTTLTVVDSQGRAVFEKKGEDLTGRDQLSSLAIAWKIPDNQVGGDYVAYIRSNLFPETKRMF